MTKSDASARLPWRWSAFAAVCVMVILFPFYWMVVAAFREESALLAYPPQLWPTDLAPGLFWRVFSTTNVGTWLRNTALVATVATLAVVPIAAITAYALSRFRGRSVSLAALLIVVTQMMPAVLLLVPYFIIFRELGLLDGLGGLILANFAWTLPVTAWLMRSAFDGVPTELEEAAMVDGCGRFGALWRIAVPLAMPGLVASAVFAFISSWDEYFFARTLISDSANWVVSVGLGSFSGDYATSWQKVMAVATISTLPPAILFLFVQRAFVENVSAGGVKG
ncbi:MAG: carbohydrate ABC transporter permease [Alphaproteobacteria bacterium]|nr:carbohydrate ABC transporter permease [Alphaproteobacteria bacterium]